MMPGQVPEAAVLSTVFTAAFVPAVLLIQLLLVRALSRLWIAVVSRRPLPIVVHPLNWEHRVFDLVDGQPAAALDLPSRVRDFLASDAPLSPLLAPGIINLSSPEIPSAVAGSGQDGWMSHLMQAVLPQRRASFNVHITLEISRPGDRSCRRDARIHPSRNGQIAVGVQVIRTPGDVLVAARSLREPSVDELALSVAAFAVEAVQQQPAVLRRAPRWEHWASRGGYGAFRRAVWYQRLGRIDEAHLWYRKASRLSLGNIRLAVHRAGLHEMHGEFAEAVDLYDAIHCLWRQNVDIMFRLAAARVNIVLEKLSRAGDCHETPSLTPAERTQCLEQVHAAVEILDLAKNGLKRRVIVGRVLLATLARKRRDPGERRYWLSWFRADQFRKPLILLRASKRHEYLSAIEIAQRANRLLALHLEYPLYIDHTDEECRDSLTALWNEVADRIEQRRLGWLAHWSAACFYSRAALFEERHAPRTWRERADAARPRILTRGVAALAGESPGDWREYCEEAAIGELGRVLRNPCNRLNPRLLDSDPDMRRLHTALKGQLVGKLVALDSLSDDDRRVDSSSIGPDLER